MEEKITELIDLVKVQTQIDATKKGLEELIVVMGKLSSGVSATGKNINEAQGIKETTQAIKEKNTVINESKKTTTDYKNLLSEQAKLNQKLAETEAGLNDRIIATRQAISAATKERKQKLIIDNAEKNSQEQLSAQYSLSKKALDKMSDSERNNTIEGQKLEAEVNRLKAAYDKNNEAVGNNTGSVGKYEKAMSGLKSSFASTFSAVGLANAAMAVLQNAFQSIKQWVTESSDAFKKSEESIKKLGFAVKNISGGSDSDLSRLKIQAEDLMGVFSDEAIMDAQRALLDYGLTSQEVYKLMPLLIDTAAQSGRDLETVSNAVLRGIEGQSKGLKTLGVEFKDEGNEVANFNTIQEQLKKFTGGASDALETQTGQLALLGNELDNQQEKLGAYAIKIETTWAKVKGFFTKIVGSLLMSDEEKQAIISEETTKRVEKRLNDIKTTAESVGMSVKVFAKNIYPDAKKQYLDSFNELALANEKLKGLSESQQIISGVALGYKELSEKTEYYKGVLNGLLKLQYEEEKIQKTNLKNNKVDKKEKDEVIATYTELEQKINDYKLLIEKINDSTDYASKYLSVYISYLQEEKNLTDQLTDKKITQKEYDDGHLINLQKLTNAQEDYNKALKEAVSPEAKLASPETKTDLTEKYLKSVSELQDKYRDEEEEKELSKQKEINDAKLELAKEAVSSALEIIDNGLDVQYDNEKHARDEKYKEDKEKLDKQKEEGLLTEDEYNKELKTLDNKAAAADLEARIQKAKDEKVMAAARIAIATAENVVKSALTPYLIPYIIGLGLAQLAVVAATPLPQYAKGRKGGKAELAKVAEYGTEGILHEGKLMLTPDKPTTMFLPAGADVIPHNKLINALYENPSISFAENVHNNIEMQKVVNELKGLRQEFKNKPSHRISIKTTERVDMSRHRL